VLLLALFACGNLTDDQIEAVVDANTKVLANVEARAEQLETKVAERRHGQGDGDYTYDGSLEADGAWDSGVVALTGSGSSRQAQTILFYAWQLDYQEIEVDGLGMDRAQGRGPVDATISITIAEGEVTVLYQVSGTLEVSGEATGSADMDWEMAADSSTGGQPVYSGTINGKDLSKLDL
jgi:hypothetical protein